MTKKELLVLLYYLLEFAECALFNQIASQSLVTNTAELTLLSVVEDIICTYQRCDPHTVQISLSILSLLCANELQHLQLCQLVRTRESSNANVLESVENIATVYYSETGETGQLA